MAVEIEEADHRRFVQRNSLLGGDFLQRVVDVRQMIGGDVAHEGARDFVVAHAAMQPAQEQNKLHVHGNDRDDKAQERDVGRSRSKGLGGPQKMRLVLYSRSVYYRRDFC